MRFGSPSQFVSNWLQTHPSATIKPISRMFTTNTKTRKTSEWVYIWVEDGEQSLNVDLVRAGVFAGAAMFDMVDNRKGLDELLKDPKLAAVRAEIQKERAGAPQDRTERLVTEDDYKARMRRIEIAEAQARKEKLGIWSNAMKAERESEGVGDDEFPRDSGGQDALLVRRISSRNPYMRGPFGPRFLARP